MYESLKTKEYSYIASITRYTDLWHDKYPVDYKLRLKVGARVMFQRNDSENSKIVNGTMGWVRRLTDDRVFVEIDGGDTVEVDKAVWQQFDYYVDKKTKTIYYCISRI